MVNEMRSIQGSTVKIIMNEENGLEGILFQDGKMKKFFANYPDLLMFDGTYKLNDRRMPLIVLLVIDGNGESQIGGFFLVKSENISILNNLFEEFKNENPNHAQTEVILTDKHATNLNVVKHQFPNASHHLCIFDATQIFLREITTKKRGINTEQRKKCLRLMYRMLYCRSQMEYDALYQQLIDSRCQGTILSIFSSFSISYNSVYRRHRILPSKLA